MNSFPIKHPTESFFVEINFAKHSTLLNSGTVTATAFKGTDPSPQNIISGAATIMDSTKVRQRVSGGISGVQYRLTFTAISGSDTWVHEHLLPVGVNA